MVTPCGGSSRVPEDSSDRNSLLTIFAISGSTMRNRARVASGHGESGSLAPMWARIASAKYSSIPEAAYGVTNALACEYARRIAGSTADR